MDALETKLKNFVDGKLELSSEEALKLIREYRLEMDKKSQQWKKEEAIRNKKTDELLEELSRA